MCSSPHIKQISMYMLQTNQACDAPKQRGCELRVAGSTNFKLDSLCVHYDWEVFISDTMSCNVPTAMCSLNYAGH